MHDWGLFPSKETPAMFQLIFLDRPEKSQHNEEIALEW